MVMKPEPLARAVEHLKLSMPLAETILLSASGELFCHTQAKAFADNSELILVCGRYEGVDQRFIELYVDHEISIGNYVVMGGEVPAMVVIEATTRLIDGVIGNKESLTLESFTESNDNALEFPQYTRPAEFKGVKVPEVLTSGDHKKIDQWRNEQAKKLTKQRRPELINK